MLVHNVYKYMYVCGLVINFALLKSNPNSITTLHIMDDYYVIKLFIPTTSIVKFHWGFYI